MSDWDLDFEEMMEAADDDFGVRRRPSTNALSLSEWIKMPEEVKRAATQRMKICRFWLPLLLQREGLRLASSWDEHLGILDPNEAASLKVLDKIETLEAILRAAEKGIMREDLAWEIFLIAKQLNSPCPEVLLHAIHWLRRTGEPSICFHGDELRELCSFFPVLICVFMEFSLFIHNMGLDKQKMIELLNTPQPAAVIQESEEKKRRGNKKFQGHEYQEAIKFYSEAIKVYPENYIVYGNRALCFIRCKKYLNAVIDGKFATLIEPCWAKGHYRFCEALFLLGETRKAVEANSRAQKLCRGDPDGIRDLENQGHRFISKMEEAKGPSASVSSRSEMPSRSGSAVESQTLGWNVDRQELQDQAGGPAGTLEPLQTSDAFSTASPARRKGAAQAPPAEEQSPSARRKGRNRPPQPQEAASPPRSVRGSVRGPLQTQEMLEAQRELRSSVEDAHTALSDRRARYAERAFSRALELVDGRTHDLGLSDLDQQLLLFGRAAALTDIGLPEELGKARRLLEKIRSFQERLLEYLVCYALGRTYLKENRFSLALQHFSDALQMVKNQITPGKLTWPLTKEVVPETQTERFKEMLEDAMKLCRFPPRPDATCRLEKCLDPHKPQMFFTDPDFKGFVQVSCCQKCVVEYHVHCWKMLKTITGDRNEKDLLHTPCLTPDCQGQIRSIQIFSSTGLLKSSQTSDAKPRTSKKPRANQRSSSQKKSEPKKQQQFRKKQRRNSAEDKVAVREQDVVPRPETEAQKLQKAWLLYKDQVLLQISQNLELLRQEPGLQLQTLAGGLQPWLELDVSRGNHLARRLLTWQEEKLEPASAIELLLERRNRVWARVLVQELSGCLEISSRLRSWASWLDHAGLAAASTFLERHLSRLQQLDLSIPLRFSPMQEVVSRLEKGPEAPSREVLVHGLRLAPPRDVRLFIWTLEEHRDLYDSCHTILDEYFDSLDGPCLVSKKSVGNEDNLPVEKRGRSSRRKLKERKAPFFYPAPPMFPTPEDLYYDFFEDSLFHNQEEPFSVPPHLQEQVARFEQELQSRSSHFKKMLDNNPDPTRESLYDYFAQILEEHGPLEVDDPLLVGEVQFFPVEALQKIQEAGSLESFLLQSLRFIKRGSYMGMACQAVLLQEMEQGAPLDHLDEQNLPENLDEQDFLSELLSASRISSSGGFKEASSSQMFQPNLYSIVSTPSLPPAPTFIPEDPGGLEPPPAEEHQDLLLGKPTAQDLVRTVAVNTEPQQPNKSFHGDLIRMEKQNHHLAEQIAQMLRREDVEEKQRVVSLLEDEVQQVTANIQVTNKELLLFQQKLEQETKKDQKEKKANQEELKSLKREIEGLQEENRSLTRSVRVKKDSHNEKLMESLDLSNHSAAEKMSLEDQIQLGETEKTSWTQRSLAAQVSIMENNHRRHLISIYRELSITRALLARLEELSLRLPSQDLETTTSRCRGNVQELEREISTAEAQFQQQMDYVKNGRSFSEMPPVEDPQLPEPPQVLPPQSARPPPALVEPSRSTVFQMAVEQLAQILPQYPRSIFSRFIAELRSSSGASLSGMTVEDVVSGTMQLILDYQEKQRSPDGSDSLDRAPSPVWQKLTPQKVSKSNELYKDDTCAICCEDMLQEDVRDLKCGHCFHNKCIKEWLEKQRTCPTCRDHALLPEDFPALTGRRRPAP